MSTTSKSPRKVLLAAYAVAKEALPEYAHRCTPKLYTQHQLFACLVLKAFHKTDYRGSVAILPLAIDGGHKARLLAISPDGRAGLFVRLVGGSSELAWGSLRWPAGRAPATRPAPVTTRPAAGRSLPAEALLQKRESVNWRLCEVAVSTALTAETAPVARGSAPRREEAKPPPNPAVNASGGPQPFLLALGTVFLRQPGFFA